MTVKGNEKDFVERRKTPRQGCACGTAPNCDCVVVLSESGLVVVDGRCCLVFQLTTAAPSPFPVLSWQQGHCRFGDKCNFAHGEAELRDFRGPRGGGGVGDRNGAGMGPQGGYYQRQQPGGYQPAGRPGPYQQQGPPMSEHEIWVASGCPVQGPGGWTQYQVRRSDPDRFGGLMLQAARGPRIGE